MIKERQVEPRKIFNKDDDDATKRMLIVHRLLLAKQITIEEAVKLLSAPREIVDPPVVPATKPQITWIEPTSQSWIFEQQQRFYDWIDRCPCNPKNGGSGICSCCSPGTGPWCSSTGG